MARGMWGRAVNAALNNIGGIATYGFLAAAFSGVIYLTYNYGALAKDRERSRLIGQVRQDAPGRGAVGVTAINSYLRCRDSGDRPDSCEIQAVALAMSRGYDQAAASHAVQAARTKLGTYE